MKKIISSLAIFVVSTASLSAMAQAREADCGTESPVTIYDCTIQVPTYAVPFLGEGYTKLAALQRAMAACAANQATTNADCVAAQAKAICETAVGYLR